MVSNIFILVSFLCSYNESKPDFTELTTVAGSVGMELCASGNRVNSPLGMSFQAQGIPFVHCVTPNSDPSRASVDLATWDQPSDFVTTHLTINACSFNGTGTTHRAIWMPDSDPGGEFITNNEVFGYERLSLWIAF
jgi:hypothetical protein